MWGRTAQDAPGLSPRSTNRSIAACHRPVRESRGRTRRTVRLNDLPLAHHAASPASMMRSNHPPDSAISLPFFNRIDPDRTFGATVGTLRPNEYAVDWDAYFSLQENISSPCAGISAIAAMTASTLHEKTPRSGPALAGTARAARDRGSRGEH
jgi:hypothetical protein